MRRVLLVCVLLMLAFAVPASAQTPLEQAKALTNEASVQYKLGRFSAALQGYTNAYERYPTPGLLFNIAQCHRMLTNYEQAIYFYKGYLRDKPDAANRTDVETLVRETERDLEAERAQHAEAEAREARAARDARDAREKAEAETRARAAEEEARAAEERAHARSAPPPPPAASAATGARGSGARRIAGLALGAAGAIVLGTGVYFGLHASSDSSTIGQLASQRAAWSAHDESVYDDGSRSAHVANALYVIGAATVAAGGVLAFLGWRKTGAASPVSASIAPVASTRSSDSAPRGASLLLSGSF